MYVLKDFWKGNIVPSDRGYRKDSPYGTMVQQTSKIADEFYKELSSEGKKAFDTYCDQQCQIDDLRECDAFIRGFRMGARMILDVVGDYASPTIPVNGGNHGE